MHSGLTTFLAYLLAGVLLIAAIVTIATYNRLVTLKNRYLNAMSQIDVQLKRRHDLVPSLVESARAYLSHEQSTLEEIARLRAAAFGGLSQSPKALKTAPAETIQNDLALSSAMGHLSAVMESYPNLKADRTVASLMEDLSSVENRISFARQSYNDAVMEYNQTRESFPAHMFASMLGFGLAWHWWAEPASRSRPAVS
ncbi:MAG: LemA family protein [Deltaproteobacteria bacterium]|nr:LemA family protein [Deltaproteobacteria bacterium]